MVENGPNMAVARDLLQQMLSVNDAAVSGDKKRFAMLSKNFASYYRRADLITQGEFHHLWCEARDSR